MTLTYSFFLVMLCRKLSDCGLRVVKTYNKCRVKKGEKLSDSGQEKSFIKLSGINIIYEDENSLQNFQL